MRIAKLAGSTALFLFVCYSFSAETASAQYISSPYLDLAPMRTIEPGWAPYVLAAPQTRARLAQMPIEQRPYRPFHFYGNTIRRTYYRGTPVPTPRDIVQDFVPAFSRILIRR